MNIEKVAEENAVVGEGPLWNADEQTLMWSDIQTGRMFSFDPASGENVQIHDGCNVGGFMQNRQGGYVHFIWDGVMLWNSDKDCVRIHPESLGDDVLRFNDVTAAPNGAAFAGTFFEDDRVGKLYRFNPDGTVDVVEEGIACSNGMGFSPDLKTMYYTDSVAREIYAYDFDPDTSAMSNKRVFVKVAESDGLPDGMTVDAEGYVWSASWFGSCIHRYDPDGVEERRIETPATQTSSVMFGGKDLDEIYFTTASCECSADDGGPVGYDWDNYAKSYRGGGLFRITGLGIRGREEFKADFAWPA